MTIQAQTNVPIEICLTPAGQHGDDAEVWAVFTGPEGEEWKVPAFLTGDGTFRVRFAAPAPGRYTYRAVCSDAGDLGLDEQTGDLEVIPYDGAAPLYRHGRLRVAETRRTLEHADGTPFFWMGDTWWMGLCKRLDWPDGFASLTADRVAKGFNLVQIVAGPLPDFDAEIASWHPQQANEAGWPWMPDWERINPAFYDLADMRIAHLVENGLVPCIVGMWGYYLTFMGVEKAKQHWRNLVARYSAYPVVWCIAGELDLPTYSRLSDHARMQADQAAQKKGWREVARYVREIDPCSNPITAHPWYGHSPREMLRDPAIDIEMLQTGHSGYYSMKPTVKMLRDAVSKRPPMPVIDGEPAYEGIMGGSRQEVQRFMFWACMTSGAAGHTYGAQGIWQMNSRDEPFAGTTMNWGDGFWQDVMHMAGSAQVGIGRRFFERYPWWLFQPRDEPEARKAGRVSSLATGIPGKVAVFYLAANCVEGTLMGVQGTRIRMDPGVKYSASFFNPRTGQDIETDPVTPDTDNMWPIPQKPTMEDWVLVLARE